MLRWCVCVCCLFRCMKVYYTNHGRTITSRKVNTIYLENKGFCLCSDVEKYKYTPGEHKVAERIGAPRYFFLLPFLEMSVLSNDFPLVEVRKGLPEERGLFSKIEIPRYTFVCNYGGKLMMKREGMEYLDRDGDFCYLYEFSFEKDGRNTIHFYNHTAETYSFGKFINHSKPHSNVLPKVFFRSDAQPEIMFISFRKISEGEEILFDYRRLYKGVKNCVSSCRKCTFLFKK